MVKISSGGIQRVFEHILNFLTEEPPHSTRTIRFIGIIEILIGSLSLLAIIFSWAFAPETKTTNVLIFVVMTGTMSTLIGVGILNHDTLAYQLLLYFSSVIILSKILILAGIIQLNGALTTFVPSVLQIWISVLYHAFLIYYLCRKDTRQHFFD